MGSARFLDDGRIEIDTNTVERSIRPIALNRKNALFAGSDEGGANWAIVASLIETCKLNGVNPHAWLADTLTKLVNGWPASKIDDLMPWAYAKIPPDPSTWGRGSAYDAQGVASLSITSRRHGLSPKMHRGDNSLWAAVSPVRCCGEQPLGAEVR